MIAGFDYGSSNCAIGVPHSKSGTTGGIELLPMYGDQRFLPSTLYALSRELICEAVAKQIENPVLREQYMKERDNQLRMAANARREHDIAPGEPTVFVGEEAIENYIDLPEEGYFIKSPKSFLGVSGLRAEHIAFFEDIVSAMMFEIKKAAERNLGGKLRHTVIGRPVNFQGLGGEDANKQACAILNRAAERAGFESVELLYEPLAAGINFESDLTENKTVLVVDVGGGTTDCSVVRMGPEHRAKADRSDDFLGHSGSRVGGNDLDINLAYRGLMPVFGMGGTLRSGRPLPSQPYWNAVSVNDIPAQTEFNSMQNIELMEQLKRDAEEPHKLARLLQLQEMKQNYQLVRSAEQAKIKLSDQSEHTVDLNYIDQALTQAIGKETYELAVDRPVAKIVDLMTEALNQAQCTPDLIYVTGGTAKSPVVRKAIAEKLGDIPVVDGDHFGSVTAGLTQWAEKLYR
ncbi:molecular chaperone [Pontibacterium granulatum]|uniref:molecular chaperone n=1 Tax=Pontibacterium granulatum TaxID=2036029 RepID=UPI00249CB005|nr:molecular chaperone [Pontibacterium granulatum]MDI3323948.1 molecular chaperone [Pontibacterium granulatum]